MSVGDIAKTAGRAIHSNAPKILTGLSVLGVVTTSVMAVKATPDVVDILRAEANELNADLTVKQIVALSWKHYIPAATMGVATIACVVGANAVNAKRTAVLMSAYSLTENAFKEYKNKVIETLGEKADDKVREGLASDRIVNNPVIEDQVINTGYGDALFHESTSGRYFLSNLESVRKSMNDINYVINNDGYSSLNDFYELLGLAPTSLGEVIGWRSDNMLEIITNPVMSSNGRPAISIDYKALPSAEYYRNF